MVKALIPLLILHLFLFQTKEFKDTSRFSYKGNVKTVIIRQYENANTIDNPKMGKLSEYSRVQYFNEQGSIDSIHYLSSDDLGLISPFERNENGETIERIIPPDNKERIQKTTTHTLISKNEFKLISVDARGVESEIGTSYFKNDLLVEQSYKSYGTEPFKTVFEYNESNQLISLKKTSNEVHIHKFLYKYFSVDEFGNWTKRLKLYIDEHGKTTYSNYEIAEYEYYK